MLSNSKVQDYAAWLPALHPTRLRAGVVGAGVALTASMAWGLGTRELSGDSGSNATPAVVAQAPGTLAPPGAAAPLQAAPDPVSAPEPPASPPASSPAAPAASFDDAGPSCRSDSPGTDYDFEVVGTQPSEHDDELVVRLRRIVRE